MKHFLLLGVALLLGSTVASSAPPAPKPNDELELAKKWLDITIERFIVTLPAPAQEVVDSPSVVTPARAAVVPNRLYQVAEGAKFRTYHGKQLRYHSRWHKINGRWYKFYHLPGRKRPLPQADLPPMRSKLS